MKRSPAVLLCFLLVGISSAMAADGGVNRLDATTAGLVDKVFERYAERDCPGCAVGVARNGEVLYTRGYGMANLEYSVKIAPDTIFEAGSVSKQFTAAAILLLAREAKLSLDDDIRRYLPEVPDFGHEIRIRNLLNHTSGLRDQWGLLTAAGRPPGSVVHSLEEILDLVGRQRALNFTPGTEYLYSNTGYSLLAWIVSRAGGSSLAEFSRKEIFEPLKMSSTQWRDDHTRVVRNRATAYIADRTGAYRTCMSFTDVYGNGGLLTTVGDLLKWNENFVKARVLNHESLEEMQRRSRLSGGEEIDYALGLQVTEYKGLREISHGGSTAGYRAFLLRFPDQHLSVALLCNLGNVNPAILAHQVAETFLPGRLTEARVPSRAEVPQESLRRRTGLYRNGETDEFLRVNLRNGKLVLGSGSTEMIPVAEDRFRLDSGTEIIFEESGAAAPMRLRQVPVRGRAITYTSVPAVSPSPSRLAEYAGVYFSEELEVSYTVAVRGGELTVRHRYEPEVRLEPAYADAFAARDNSRILRFTRDGEGKVDGMNLFSGRVRHLRFIRIKR